jgi:myosin heavy subunit
LAATKVQQYQRRYVAQKKYRMLKSATVSLQCATRSRTARKALFEFQKEQKDVGKLKGVNEKLKQEMASLRAMLSAQAKGSAADTKHAAALKEKEDRIAELEKKIASIEKELATAKAMVEKLESNFQLQSEESARDKEEIENLRSRKSGTTPIAASNRKMAPPPPAPPGSGSASPKRHSVAPGRRPSVAPQSTSEAIGRRVSVSHMKGTATDTSEVNADVLNSHRAKVAILEEELELERQLREEADNEILKLRAAVGGVNLEDGNPKTLDATRDSTVSDDATRYVHVLPHIVFSSSLRIAGLACWTFARFVNLLMCRDNFHSTTSLGTCTCFSICLLSRSV